MSRRRPLSKELLEEIERNAKDPNRPDPPPYGPAPAFDDGQPGMRPSDKR